FLLGDGIFIYARLFIAYKIKVFKRVSFGVHSFENFRKRLLLICGPVHLVHSPIDTINEKLNDKNGSAS
ncbi:MAG: hypothetical protein LUH14_02210, partial [Clostridiaceae bacterium]|nr:hypothetical protein [Clostridiaceae bacterium]